MFKKKVLNKTTCVTTVLHVARLYELNIDLSSPALKSGRCILRKGHCYIVDIHFVRRYAATFCGYRFESSCPLSDSSLFYMLQQCCQGLALAHARSLKC